jgi:serine protease Do
METGPLEVYIMLRNPSAVRRSLALGALVVATTSLSAIAQQPTSQSPRPQASDSALEVATAMEEVMGRAIEACERSVVAIARVRRENHQRDDLTATPFNQFQSLVLPQPGEADFIPNEYATGVIIDAGGLILTANHVVRDDSDYWITTADHKTYKVVKIVGADPRSDLAVLAIEASGLKPIKFGTAAGLKKGQFVIALGNPYAIARDGQASASWGIISNLGRKDRPWVNGPAADSEVTTPRPTLHQLGSLIQTDARLNLGTSGGALVNLKGEMIGLTVALAATLGYEQSAGFALPVDEAFLRAVNILKQGREVEYGFLGVKPLPLARDLRLRGQHGVAIQEVVESTPAERAGLIRGDVITHINDEPIYDPDDLMLAIGRLAADASVKLSIEREGAPRVLMVQELAKYWVPGRKIITTPAPAWRGLRVDYVTSSREFMNWVMQRRTDLGGSVLITEVEENSPAWQEGLRPNMMISHVGGRTVTTPRAFHEAVQGQEGPVKLRLSLPPNEQPLRAIPPATG